MMPGSPWRGLIGSVNGEAFTFQADATFEETGTDELVITEHPVEQGAAITDHAYKRPARIAVRFGFSPSSPAQGGGTGYVQNGTGRATIPYLQGVYNFLLKVQNGREPFTLYTGKRAYANVLIAVLRCTTDRRTENILAIDMVCQEVIIVQTVTTTVKTDQSVQVAPQDTTPVVNTGQAQAAPTSLFNAAAVGE